MCYPQEFIDRIDDLIASVDEVVELSFNQNSQIAEELNREQLQRGEGGNGLMPQYSRTSQILGKSGNIKLFETGDFYEGITYGAQGGVVSAFSTDWKSKMLEDIYQVEQPLKLNDDSVIELKKVLEPTLIENAKERLML